jgi:hypothetical protein
MPTTKRWKTLNRLYAAISALWIVWLLLIVPIQIRHRAETRLGERMATCTHLAADGRMSYDGACMDVAEHLYVIDKSEGSYARTLPALILAALGVPLALYGLIAIPAIVLRCLGRTHPDAPPENTPA